MELSRTIRELRYRKGWSTLELASRAGMSRSALTQLERGATSKPHAETLKRIARAFGVPIEVLVAAGSPGNGVPVEVPEPRVPPQFAMPRENSARFSPAQVEELVEMFKVLLSSPLAEGIARIIEESSRLVPIILPGGAFAGPSRVHCSDTLID